MFARFGLSEKDGELMTSSNHKRGRKPARYPYVDDPAIPLRVKRLQMALDYEPPAPEEVEDALRAKLAGGGRLRVPGRSGYVDFRDDWEAMLTPEAMASRRASYARHMALAEEARALGFVKGGNCVPREGRT